MRVIDDVDSGTTQDLTNLFLVTPGNDQDLLYTSKLKYIDYMLDDSGITPGQKKFSTVHPVIRLVRNVYHLRPQEGADNLLEYRYQTRSNDPAIPSILRDSVKKAPSLQYRLLA